MCKTLTCLFLSGLALGLLQTGVAEAADPSLVAHYRLDEGAGAIAHDSSGSGYDGMVLGQPQWVSGPDDSGVALAFNPSNACTGIECPTFDPTDGTGQFSFTIWAFWDGEETYHHFFTKSDGWGQATMMFQLELWGGSTSADHFNRVGISYDPDSVPFYVMPKNEWTHLAFVYDGAEMVVYLNGVDDMGPKPVTLGPAVDARTVIGVADNDQRVWTGALDDVRIYSRPLAEGEVVAVMEGRGVGLSSRPQPEHEATDVPCDVTLSWAAGEFASTHDVYLGTVFDDVNNASRTDPRGVLASQGQPAASYDPPGMLDLGTTYYWRVDEVNAAPDYTIFKGEVWNFTTEPVGYPIEGVMATSNGISDDVSTPQRTVDGSGIDDQDQASVKATHMWLATPPADEMLYIQYEFDGVYKLHEMLVWNYNVQFELILGFGLKDVTVEYSENGTDWTTLGDVEFARATAQPTYTANTTVDLAGVAARYVRLTVNSGWGMMGQFGLSEVRFLAIPVQAREPEPADGAVDVDPETTLSWRAGRNASSHDVYLGTDPEALGLIDTVGEASIAPGNLVFGRTYYWQIVEVNEADAVPAWAGDIWSFSTKEYALIDGFETYDDDIDAATTIFDTWVDGWVNDNGSTVGYFDAPFAEQTVVRTGGQSMPLVYDNTASPFYSEAERTFDTAQDWTGGGADTLVMFVRGNAPDFVEAADGSIVMSAIGADIWDVADQFRYAYKNLSGDGSIVVRVDSLVQSNEWAKAGVMIRETLEPGSQHAFVAATPTASHGISFQRRPVAGQASENTDVADVELPHWLKLTRTGNVFTAQESADGVNWVDITVTPAVSIQMNSNVYIGLAVTSHDAAVVTSAEFSNLSTTGNVTGAWQTAGIGVAQPEGNSPESMYVAIEDSSGQIVRVTAPDDAIAVRSSWQEWRIPYSDLVGVNLSRVEKMYIGVGSKISPTAGGTGIVYIDDIGYGSPATP